MQADATTSVLPPHAAITIVGAGIVGCSVAYHLTRLGWRDVVVLEQGPLGHTGGSTSHAAAMLPRTSASRTMTELAIRTMDLYAQLHSDELPCLHPVGSLEVALTPARWTEFKRKQGWATRAGIEAHLLTPAEARDKLPLIDAGKILGAFWVPTDGIAEAVNVLHALMRVAGASGASFHGHTEVTGIELVHGRVAAVETTRGRIATDTVVLCAGIWGPRIGRTVGVPIPLIPAQHQLVHTSPLAALAGETRPAVYPLMRSQDRRMYFRQYGDGYGIGSYQHEPLLVEPDDILPHACVDEPASLPFTPEDFAPAWRDAVELMPALRDVTFTRTLNGMFAFTPDGAPLLGEAAAVRGLWVAEGPMIMHAGGAGECMAAWITHGDPGLDIHECDLNRFEPHATSPSYVRRLGAQRYREFYDIIHPLQPMEQPRPLRVSPFYEHQRQLGAVFFEARGWERPQWYAANEELLASSHFPARDDWASRHWSPITYAEHVAARERVALFDLSSLPKVEVTGTGALALLQRLCTNQLDRPIGRVTYSLLLDAQGGIRSDVTVARLGPEHFQLGCNGPLDLHWIRQHARDDPTVQIRDVTGSLCCLGVWGPRARDVVARLSEDDVSNAAFPYYSARRITLGEVPIVALRVSYVGELGWELYTSPEYGARLWDLLWQAGQPFGILAAGRAAFDSLRLEKGYRAWGAELQTEYNLYEAGLGAAVRLDKGDFIGRDALLKIKAAGIGRKLCCLILDDRARVVMGGEPLFAGERCIGYVTSAGYGPTVEQSIAYGYLPLAASLVPSRLAIEYFGERLPATVTSEPLYDAGGARLRG